MSVAPPHDSAVTRWADRLLGGAIPVTLGVALVWSYWSTCVRLAGEWNHRDDYSVGVLVPFAAAYLLWHDRDRLARVPIRPAWVGGIAVILLAAGLRVVGVVGYYDSIERYSIVVTVIGLVILVAGWRFFGAVKWVLLFLFLMAPWPGVLHNQIALPLQTLATDGALVALELFGIQVSAEGHQLVLNNAVEIAIGEECSGLRMLSAFVVTAAFMAYLVERPFWQRLVILASSVPIAIICNAARLVVTSMLYLWVSDEVGQKFFHDFAGVSMMPAAIGMLLAELWVMSKLIVEETHVRGKNNV